MKTNVKYQAPKITGSIPLNFDITIHYTLQINPTTLDLLPIRQFQSKQLNSSKQPKSCARPPKPPLVLQPKDTHPVMLNPLEATLIPQPGFDQSIPKQHCRTCTAGKAKCTPTLAPLTEVGTVAPQAHSMGTSASPQKWTLRSHGSNPSEKSKILITMQTAPGGNSNSLSSKMPTFIEPVSICTLTWPQFESAAQL